MTTRRIVKPSTVTTSYKDGRLIRHVSKTQQDESCTELPWVPWLPRKFRCFTPVRDPPINSIGIDAASVACVWALDLQPEDSVLDLCAAPGGKAMIMAEIVDQVVAVDVSHQRLNVMRSLLKKHGYHNIVILESDARQLKTTDSRTFQPHYAKARAKRSSPQQIADLPEVFTKVLIDAECSHDGSKRHVIKFGSKSAFEKEIMTQENLSRLIDTQYSLLKNGWKHLDKSNERSRLVYSTCSFKPEQNEQMIYRFLADHAEEAELDDLPFDDKVPFLPIYLDGLNTKTALFGKDNQTSGLYIAKLKSRRVV